jgi:hypothetical protein
MEAHDRLIAAIRSKESFAFAGAGISRPLGYPTWSGLLKQLAVETRTMCGDQIVNGEGKPLTVSDG